MWLETRSCGGNRDTGKISAMKSDLLGVKLCFRPSEFVKKTRYPNDSEEDLSTAGKMPPDSESEHDE